jgi:hypothetical protein
VFTARYALSPYIKQIRFFFKGLIYRAYILGSSLLNLATTVHIHSTVIRPLLEMIPPTTQAIYLTAARPSLHPIDTTRCPVLSGILTQLFPLRDHL